MIPLSLAEIAEIVGGRLHNTDGAEVVTGSVEFDTRRLGSDGLFVAIPGERVDGHDFAAEAMARGACGVLSAREVAAPAVIVPRVTAAAVHRGVYALAGDSDGSGAAVLAALGALAGHVVARLRAEHGLRTVAVTGSAGKTSTKDLLGALLSGLGETVAPSGSFNNEIGVPWTALQATERTRFLVLEYSARGVGHIAELATMVRPEIGVVLNVGTSHLDEFGSVEAIAQAKGELVEALPAAADGGVAILNADDDRVAAMATRTEARVITVGESAAAALRACEVTSDERDRARFTLRTALGDHAVSLGLHGAHQVGNALAAAAVAQQLGADLAAIAQGLATARAVSGKRMQVTE
ncbi:MAG: UDP-N-acetylmuramoyl-tripeptide--D-alanyl-D-alanine ligase, partial [Sciscionella sp.]